MVASVAWGIDIGKSSLKAVKIRNIKGELEIEELHYYQYDKVAPDMDVEGAQQEALDRLIRDVGIKRIKKDAVSVCLPAQTAFCRFLELPPVDAKRIDETIALEAKQQIPFPIENVNWGYHKIDREYGPGEQVEVGIFAIKKEMVQEFVGRLKGHGLEPEVLTIAPLALYNFATFDCKTEGGAILLDIGADQTNLVIVDEDRMWIRNLPIAGNDITKSLENKFEIPFKEAEKLKKNARKSSNAKKIFSVMQPVLKDFVSEVLRSLNFYKSKQKKSKLSRVLMTGNGTKLFNLTTFLNKELDYKIRRVQQLNNFSIDPDADMELLKTHLPSFSVAFGLAIQTVGIGQAKVNLLPREDVQRKTLQQKAPALFIGAGLMLLGSILAWLLMTGQVSGAEGTLDEILKKEVVEEIMGAREDLEKAIEGVEEPMRTAQELAQLAEERFWAHEIYQRLAQVVQDGSALPWRDASNPDKAEIPDSLPPDRPNEWGDSAYRAMLDANSQKTWILGIDLERKVEGELVYYEVRLAAARRNDATPLELFNKLDHEVGDKIRQVFELEAEDKITTQGEDLSSLTRQTSTSSNPEYYLVEFVWGYPVANWKAATAEEDSE